MRTRELPREEWGRLAHTEMSRFVSESPDCILTVIAVEDDSGAIIGCWSLVTLLHAEGVWIDPAHRKGASVARRLIGAMWQQVRALGVRGLLTGAATQDVALLLEKLGAKPAPFVTYSWQVRD